jgi:hypothetical protein
MLPASPTVVVHGLRGGVVFAQGPVPSYAHVTLSMCRSQSAAAVLLVCLPVGPYQLLNF